MATGIFMLLLGIANSFRFPNYIHAFEEPWQFFPSNHGLRALPERAVREISFRPWMNANSNGQILDADRKPETLESNSRLPLEPPTEHDAASADMTSPRPR